MNPAQAAAIFKGKDYKYLPPTFPGVVEDKVAYFHPRLQPHDYKVKKE